MDCVSSFVNDSGTDIGRKIFVIIRGNESCLERIQCQANMRS